MKKYQITFDFDNEAGFRMQFPSLTGEQYICVAANIIIAGLKNGSICCAAHAMLALEALLNNADQVTVEDIKYDS